MCIIWIVDLPADRNKCLWLWGTTYLSERGIHWLCGMNWNSNMCLAVSFVQRIPCFFMYKTNHEVPYEQHLIRSCHWLPVQLFDFSIFWLSMPDEGYFRNVLCTINLISTLLLLLLGWYLYWWLLVSRASSDQ